MKKSLSIISIFTLLSTTSCNEDLLVVYTESGFAPFEYISNSKIVGVDVDIMNKVGEKLNKKVVFENINFNMIIDIVSAGKLTNVGAAGLSITEERLEKVDFSIEYYKANLYAIYDLSDAVNINMMSDNNEGIYWHDLANDNGIGVQTGTTADLFLSDEVTTGGLLEGVKKTDFSSLDVAISSLLNNDINYVIIDELPAKKLVSANNGIACLPLYYQDGDIDEPAYDSYAICVTKGQTDLLNTINEVLTEMLIKDENGISEIEKLVNKHLGL